MTTKWSTHTKQMGMKTDVSYLHVALNAQDIVGDHLKEALIYSWWLFLKKWQRAVMDWKEKYLTAGHVHEDDTTKFENLHKSGFS